MNQTSTRNRTNTQPTSTMRRLRTFFGRTSLLTGLAVGIAVLYACKSPLDIEPPFEVPTEEALSTTENLESALNGAYNAAVSGAALGGGLRLFPDVISDHTSSNIFAVTRGNLPANLQNMYRRLLFGVADPTWRSCYQAINRANNILAAIDKGFVKNQDGVYAANVGRIRGEALFLRAVMHFELCRMYGIQYGEPGYDDPNGQRGVIISTTASENRNGAIRSSTKEVYDQVLQDLRAAATLMPEERGGVAPGFLPAYGGIKGGRATKMAAFAYLSRVYFQQGTDLGNDSALHYINLVLPAPNTLAIRGLLDDYIAPNGVNLAENDPNSFNLRGFESAKETIFQVVNTVDEATGTFNTSNNLITSSYVWSTANAQFPSYFLTSRQFFDDAGYSVDGGADKRYSFFTKPLPTDISGVTSCIVDRTNSKVVGKYFFRSLPSPFDPTIGVVNIVVNRLSELIITRAEINAYKGNISAALEDVNALRRRAFGVPNTSTSVDIPSSLPVADIVRKIRQERIREMAFEGDRLYNLRRMARLFENGVPTGLTETRNNFQLTNTDRTQCERVLVNIHVNDPQLLFQIPDAELSSNPNIRRN